MKKKSYQRKIVVWLLDNRMILLACICLITCALGYQLRDPAVLFQDYTSDEQEDTGGEQFKKFAHKFGEGELLMVVIKAKDIFTTETLIYIRSLTEAIKKVSKVQKVKSITNANQIINIDGNIQSIPFFEEIPVENDILQAKKQAILSNPLWAGNLVSTDSTVTVVNVFLPPLIRGSTDASTVIDELREILDINKPGSIEAYLTGLSPMLSDTMGAISKDFKTFFVLTWLLMAGFLFLAFRTVRGVLIPLGVTMLTVVWVLGLIVVVGEKLSMVGAMLPSLVGVICFSDAVHVLNHYDEQVQNLDDKYEITLRTMEHMLKACFLTSFTTATAFGTLIVANLSSIRQFGTWVAIGIMLGYVLIITLTPIILYMLPLPKKNKNLAFEQSFSSRLLLRIAHFTQGKKIWIPIATAILISLSCVTASFLQVETSFTAFLPNSSPSMKGLAVLQGKLAGFGKVELVLEGSEGTFKEPWALKELREMELFLEKQPEVKSTLSVNNLLQWTYGLIEKTHTDLLTDPYAKRLIGDYLYMFSNLRRSDQLSSLITDDYSTARVTARLNATGAGEQVELLEDLGKYVDQHLDSKLTYRITGEAGRIAKQIQSVINSLLSSLGLTLVVIALLMFWMLKSLKMTLFVMVPNILPVIMTLGIMGAVGIKLNFATIMITSIAVGIAVDDTIHFLVRYIREIKDGLEPGRAVENTILHSGRAIVLTSVIIASGCSIFALSEFAPSRHFGLLMAFAMIAALLTDLFVLPYFLRLWKLKFNTRVDL